MRRRPGRRPVAPLRPLAALPALAALLHIGKLLAGEDLDDALRRQRRGAGGGCRSEREGDRPDRCDDAMHGFLAKNAPSGPTRKRPLRFRRRIASAISTSAAALSWHLLPQSSGWRSTNNRQMLTCGIGVSPQGRETGRGA